MPRVLIVEDSASMRAFVRGALEEDASDLGAVEVVEADSGFDALRLLPRGPYDLVISDINMPDINGLELVQFIRKSELHRSIPVLLISTRSSDRDRDRGLSLGATGYLAKPFTPEMLRQEAARQLLAAQTRTGSHD
jgi:two-component system chemotaxis response regulator CheY